MASPTAVALGEGEDEVEHPDTIRVRLELVAMLAIAVPSWERIRRSPSGRALAGAGTGRGSYPS